MGLLNGDQLAQCGRQIFLIKHLANFGRPPLRQKDLGVARPACVGLRRTLHRSSEVAVGRETVVCQADSGCRHIGKTHGAMLGQGGEPGVRGARCQRTQDAGRQLALVMPLKIVHRSGLWPDAQAIDGYHFTAIGKVDDGRGHTEKIALVGMHHVERQANSHPGVDGIAPTPQDVEPGHGGSRMASDHHPVGTLDQRAKTRERRSWDRHDDLLNISLRYKISFLTGIMP